MPSSSALRKTSKVRKLDWDMFTARGGSSGVREVRGEVGGRVSFGGLRFGNMFGGLGVPLKNEIKGLCAKIRLAIVKLK